MVRVPTLQYHFISRILDLGAMGVVVPFVSSEEQAREIVTSAKYPPEGRRGVAFGVAHDGYRAGNLVTKMRKANEEIMLIAKSRMPTEWNKQPDRVGRWYRRTLDRPV